MKQSQESMKLTLNQSLPVRTVELVGPTATYSLRFDRPHLPGLIGPVQRAERQQNTTSSPIAIYRLVRPNLSRDKKKKNTLRPINHYFIKTNIPIVHHQNYNQTIDFTTRTLMNLFLLGLHFSPLYISSKLMGRTSHCILSFVTNSLVNSDNCQSMSVFFFHKQFLRKNPCMSPLCIYSQPQSSDQLEPQMICFSLFLSLHAYSLVGQENLSCNGIYIYVTQAGEPQHGQTLHQCLNPCCLNMYIARKKKGT